MSQDQEIQITLDSNFTSEELDRIDLFRTRFRELWNNWEDLKSAGVQLGGSFSNLGDGRVSGTEFSGVSIHRLKGYYLDFRPFWSNREPTNFLWLLGRVGFRSSDPRVRRIQKELKASWTSVGLIQEWHRWKADDLITVLFNGRLFHSNQIHRAALEALDDAMSKGLAHHVLLHCIYDRMLLIRNLNWMLTPLTQDRTTIRIPK